MFKFILFVPLILVSIVPRFHALAYNIPSEPPSNVTLEATSSSSITIWWQPPPEAVHNGQITGYKIHYRKDGEPVQVETTPANVQHWELKGLERFSAYRVMIAAMRVNRTGPFTKWHHVATYENEPDESQVPGQPGWMKIRPETNSITVKWTPPIHREIKVRSYILGWGKGAPDEETIDLETFIRTYEIRNLKPNTEYVISLRAKNNIGYGSAVYDTVRTRGDPPTRAPTPVKVPVELHAIPFSKTAIAVLWKDPTLGKKQRVTDGRYYEVKYSPTDASSAFRYYNTTSTNCMIEDLRPSTQYEFAVNVIKGNFQSGWSASVIISTR